MTRILARLFDRGKSRVCPKQGPGRGRRFRPRVETLEAREMLHGGWHPADVLGLPQGPASGSGALTSYAPIAFIVPALSSLPTAPASLYLDFDGHFQPEWDGYTNVTTPAFDLDGNPTSFSAAEVSAMTEIWQRVAEDFAPFRINVTNVNPGDFTNGKALRVAIGGSSADWLGLNISGISQIGSFSNSSPNVVYVFSQDIVSWAAGSLTDGDGRVIQVGAAVATTASHESGHAFGLQHQRLYAGDGSVIEYNPGTANRTPIMGDNLCSDRTTWFNGQVSATMTQDDMAAIAGPTNGFGYRVDDHSDTFSAATPLAWAGDQFGISGVIHKTADKDYFSFVTSGGALRLTVDVAAVGPNLDSRLELWTHQPLPPLMGVPRTVYEDTLIASAAPTKSLGASLSVTLTPGTYYVVVRSEGAYGDVGQYTLTGSSMPIGIAIPVLDFGTNPATKGGVQPTAIQSNTPPASAAGPSGALYPHSRDVGLPGALTLGAPARQLGLPALTHDAALRIDDPFAPVIGVVDGC